ncbi:hypothetical protein CK203_008439 [Vitis vinifera]|uniref:Uncharacterized protein n=1 Tax=Vitis vinifera TaxID=29760 RepID=A0A438KP93_VITVI|nr:hypothetical protein CK203_008439 [Vitis vinifera]
MRREVVERKTVKVLIERKTFLIRLEGDQGGEWCSMTEISRGSVFALGFEKEAVGWLVEYLKKAIALKSHMGSTKNSGENAGLICWKLASTIMEGHHSFRPNLSGHISIRSSLSLSLSFRPSVPVLRAKGENTFQSVESSSENTHRRQLFRRTFPANFPATVFFYTARSAWRRSPICPKAPEPETHPRAAHARFSGRRLHLTRRRVRAREPLSGDALPPPGSPDADQPPFLPVCAIRALHVPLLGFFCFRGPSDQIFRRPSAIFSQLQSLHVP